MGFYEYPPIPAVTAGTVTSIDVSGGATGLTTSGGPITTAGVITLAGTLNIGHGGTGQTTKSAAFDALSPMTTLGDLILGGASGTGTRLGIGSTGNVLTVSGGTAVWSAPATAGTVTSVSGSGGTTGLTLTGGPITSSGTLTLGGTLAVANGGTGQVTAAAAFNALSPITTTGDMIYSPSGATSQRLAVGSTGNVLTVSGGVPTWSTPSYANAITSLTGDVTATGPGSVASSLVATTNSTLTTISSLTSIGTLTSLTMGGAINMASHRINFLTDPSSAQDAATKAYVDAAVAALNPATAVYAATTTNIAGVYVPVGAGIGDTFTTTATGTFTVDGVTPPLSSRILIKDQSSGYQNGIYTITTLGSLGVSTVFTRALDYNTPADINGAGLIPVINGTLNALSSWQQVATIVSIGPAGTALVFTEFTANPSLYLLKANNLSDVASKTTSFNNLSPMTTLGDLILGGASGSGARLGIGSTGNVLTVSGGTAVWSPPATAGTVTSVALSVPATSIFGVSGSPVTSSGTLGLTTTGTSGGIPYFSSTSALSSSALLTANQLILGGGAGATPTTLAAGTQNFVLLMGASNPGYAQIVDASVSASAAIAGTKISPNFGAQDIHNSQNIYTTGTAALVVTSASVMDYSSGSRLLSFGSGSGAGNRGKWTVLGLDNAGANALTLIDSTANGITAIQFPATQVTNAGANVLDDYSEGTFSPIFTYSGIGTAYTYSFTPVGLYTKIGRLVTYTIAIANTNNFTSGSQLQISGLPYAAMTLSNANWTAQVYCLSLNTTVVSMVMNITSAASVGTISYLKDATGGGYSIFTPTLLGNSATMYITGSYYAAT